MSSPCDELTLHEYHSSGNCYKIRLTASLLSIPISKLIQYDVNAGESHTPEFLSKINPAGSVPVLQIGSSTFLPESAAAISYLAHGSHLVPTDRLAYARMLQWMFFEQYDIEPNIAVLRRWRSMLGLENLTPLQRELIPGKHAAGVKALDVMERHLAEQHAGLDGHGNGNGQGQGQGQGQGSDVFFVGDSLTLADVALFAYTHVAADAGFELQGWPHISRWLELVRKQKGFVEIDAW